MRSFLVVRPCPRILPAVLVALCGFLAGSRAPAQTMLTNIPTGNIPVAVGVNPVTNKVYAVNRGSNTVTVIDGATNATATVNVGSVPKAIAVNAITNKVYVANGAGGTVTVIDGVTNATATVTVGSVPDAVAVNPVTNKIYVTNAGSSNVTVIDGTTNAPTNVTVGDHPYAVAVNTVTNKIYVTHYSSVSAGNTVTVIDGTTNGTSSVSTGTNPYAVAVNEVTNKIYVANLGGGVTVIDGTSNTPTSVAAGTYPYAVAVNPVTDKIYIANEGSANVTVIDGATNATATVMVGTDPQAVAVNPLTNQIYVANYGGGVTVIDGATNAPTSLSAGTNPAAVGVNPITNKAYVANSGGGNVTLVDGAVNATVATVAVGEFPVSAAVNPVSGKIYVPNGTNSVTVIDALSNATGTITLPSYTEALAVNRVTNRLYVPLPCPTPGCAGNVMVIDGATNATLATVAVGVGPMGLSINEATNKIYVANLCGNDTTCKTTTGTVTEIDGATNGTTSVNVGQNPYSIAVNPVMNKIYMTSEPSSPSTGAITVIDGASNFATTIPEPNGPHGLAVNTVTDKVYIPNWVNTASILNGATNTITSVSTGVHPYATDVNPITNKIYFGNHNSGTITVLDGATNTTTTVAAGGPTQMVVDAVRNKIYGLYVSSAEFAVMDGLTNNVGTLDPGPAPNYVAINPLTGRIYVANRCPASEPDCNMDNPPPPGTVTVLEPNALQSLQVTLQVAGVVDSGTVSGYAIFATKNQSPSFTATVHSTYAPSAAAPSAFYYQLDTQTGAWQTATQTNSAGANPANYSFSLTNVLFGVHTIYVYASCGGEISNIGNFTFAILGAPPEAATMISPTPGSTLAGSSVTFTWTAGVGVTQYTLDLGTTVGGHDVAHVNAGTSTSTTVNSIPTNSAPLYVTLTSTIGGNPYANAYTYTEGGTPVAATMTSPTPGSTLTGTSATFGWTAGAGVSQYSLYVGTKQGADDIAYVNAGKNLSATVSGIPTNGGTLFIRLYSLINGAYQYHDYTYVEAGTAVKATMTSPTNGSTLHGTSATFTWTAGTGVTSYSLYVGTTRGAHDLDYVPTTTTSTTIKNLPAIGTTVYVRLYSLIAGSWQYADYTYVSSP